MTIKDAILKTLVDLHEALNSTDICKHILEKDYYQFSGPTPASTVSAQLGDFIRTGDGRVKRVKVKGGTFLYYLAKDEENLAIELLYGIPQDEPVKDYPPNNKIGYNERHLHKLLSTYLSNSTTNSKTIFHEQSNGQDKNQVWTHPDMVGIKFLNLQTKSSQNLLKSINRVDTFKISSYELKKEINNDRDLKEAYFQAVSNSSWANYGYLVAFEFNDNLHEEMTRLNQSFGIGIIELNANPYKSKTLFPASYRSLDFKTIDKLCKMNKDFDRFIEKTEKLMTADDRYYDSTEKELKDFCDDFFKNDEEIEAYCTANNIPTQVELLN